MGAIIEMENSEEEGRLGDLQAAILRLRGAMDKDTALCPVCRRKRVYEEMKACNELARLGNPNYRNSGGDWGLGRGAKF